MIALYTVYNDGTRLSDHSIQFLFNYGLYIQVSGDIRAKADIVDEPDTFGPEPGKDIFKLVRIIEPESRSYYYCDFSSLFQLAEKFPCVVNIAARPMITGLKAFTA